MTPNCMSEGAVTMATDEETMTAAENGPREWATRMLAPGHAVILDTETSDLDGSILEVAVIDAATGAVLLDTLVDPGDVQIHPAAAAVHGISAAQLIGAPDWPTVFSALAAVTADRVVLAYNASFDQSRILHDCHRHGLDPLHLADTERWGCVMVKRSQAEGVEKNIRLDGAHRACGDAEAARTVLQGIADGLTGTPAPSCGRDAAHRRDAGATTPSGELLADASCPADAASSTPSLLGSYLHR